MKKVWFLIMAIFLLFPNKAFSVVVVGGVQKEEEAQYFSSEMKGLVYCGTSFQNDFVDSCCDKWSDRFTCAKCLPFKEYIIKRSGKLTARIIGFSMGSKYFFITWDDKEDK